MHCPRFHLATALPLLALLLAEVATAIPNDQFANATDWGSQQSVAESIDTRFATRQSGEPSHANNASTGTAWWKWTAPKNGRWKVEFDESFGGSQRLVAYTGDSLGSLVEVASSYSEPLLIDVVAGQQYKLVVVHNGWSSLQANLISPPANDHFASPESLGSANQISVVGSTAVATREDGEPIHEGDSAEGGSIWWEWTAPEDGILRYDLEGTTVPNWVVNAYLGSDLADLTEIASIVIYNAYDTTRVFRVDAGTRLSFAAARRTAGTEGEVTLNLDFDAAPNNDEPENAVDLGNITTGSFSGDLSGATAEDGGSGRSLWWKWTAPNNGVLRLSEASSSFGSIDFTAYRLLADENPEQIDQGYIDPYCHAGDTLLFKVSDSSAGEFAVDLGFLSSAANDDFSNATPLAVGNNGLNAFYAGPDPGQPGDPSAATLWWRWTAPASGALIIEGLPRYYEIGLYQGTELSSLTEVSDFVKKGRWLVTAGETYSLMLAQGVTFGDPVNTNLLMAFVEATPDNDDFADSQDLGSAWSSHFFGDQSTATAEASEPSGASASRWWSWTAPQEAVVFMEGQAWGNQGPDTYYNGIRVYEGNTLSEMGTAIFPVFNPYYLDHFIAPAGKEYHFSLIGNPEANPQITDYQLHAYPLPHSNDHFANATDLGSMADHLERLTMVGATLEAGEPDHDPGDNYYISRSRWWTWTATEDRNVEISLGRANGSPYSYLLGVYEGDTLHSLQLLVTKVTSSDEIAVRFPAFAGHTYRIVAGGGTGEMNLALRSWTPPPGDRFGDPLILTEGSYERYFKPFPGTYEGASLEAGEPTPFFPDYVSLWRKWIAPADGLFEFQEGLRYGIWRVTEGSDLDTLTTEEISNGWSRWVTKGEEIMILHQTYEQEGGSAGCKFHATPSNDGFSDATDLGSAEVASDSVEIYASTLDANEPEWVTEQGSPFNPGSVWWKWTAPRNGVLRIRTGIDSNFYGDKVVIGRGSALDTFEVLLIDDHWYHETYLPVSSGETLHFAAVVENARLEGMVNLQLEFIDAPDNDVWFRAVDLGTSENASAANSNVGASLDLSEGENAGAATIWWSWTAPRDGTAAFIAEASSGSEVIRVYKSDGAGGIIPKDATAVGVDGGTALAIEVDSGETCWFSVGVTGTQNRGPVAVLAQMVDEASNNLFENAAAAPEQVAFTLESSFVGALGSAGDPNPFDLAAPAPSLWWKWTAPSDGIYRLTSPGNGMAVYEGTRISSLVEWASSPNGVLVWEAAAGSTYHFLITSTGGAWRALSLSLQAQAPASNDHFATRTVISTSTPLELESHNLACSAEPGEPAHTGAAAQNSVWFEWTASTDGGLVLEVPDSFRIAVYHGNTLEALDELISGTGSLALLVESGTSYQIAVDSGADGPGAFTLSFSPSQLSSNDNFENRTVLGSLPVSFNGEFTFAGNEPYEPVPARQTLWWDWTAPSDDFIQFEQLSGIPTIIYAYTYRNGYPLDLRYLGSRTQVRGGLQVQAGTRYFFQIGTPSTGQIGGAAFRMSSLNGTPSGNPTQRPPNDNFANRIVLDSRDTLRSSLIDLQGATNESGEPISTWDRGVWWSWTAPSSGYFKLTSLTSNARSLFIYTGAAVGSLTSQASGSSKLIFRAQAGVTYQITQRIDSFYLERGTRDDRLAAFEIAPAPSYPANDDFARREDLGESLGVSRAGHNILATTEPSEPSHAGAGPDASVWFAWTAPSTRTFVVNAFGAAMKTGIYTGDSLDSLIEVASGTDPVEFEGLEGVTYAIALDRPSASEFSIRINEIAEPVDPSDPPVNDHFADSIAITGTDVAVSGSLTMATLEEGEALASGSNTLASVWWSWTAPQNGVAVIGSDGTYPYPRTAIFRGNTIEDLELLVHADREISLEVDAGALYHIAVLGSSPAFDLNIGYLTNTVANDHFSAAEELSGTHLVAAGSTVGASMQPGEPSHGITSSYDAPRSVWFEWTCPTSGDYDVEHDLSGSTGMGIYIGEQFGLLNLIARDSSELRFRAIAGLTYRIAVAKAGTPGRFNLSIQRVSRPSNDDFANRIDLGSALGARGSGTTFEATREEGERQHNFDYYAGGTLWWTWTAPASGRAFIDASPSEDDIIIAAYTGTDFTTLTVVAEGSGKYLSFDAIGGTTYQLVVGADAPYATGPVEFEIGMEIPANDNFADAIALPSSLPTSVSSSTAGATVELGEPNLTSPPSLGSLWWEWTPSTDELVDFILGSSSTGLKSAVFTGDLMPFLAPVAGSIPAQGVFRFQAVAGVNYRILVATTRGGQAPPVDFQILPARELPVNDHFANALNLSGSTATSTSHNWGASTEPGEPESHSRSLWWRWTAPKSGAVKISTNGIPALYCGAVLSELEPVRLAADATRSFIVEKDTSYQLAVSTYSSPSEVSVNLEMSPTGDYFSDPIILPSTDWHALFLNLQDFSKEELEPPHAGGPPVASAWIHLTAPHSGHFQILSNANRAFRIAVYEGNRIASLSPVSEGVAEVGFHAVGGTSYRIVFDKQSDSSSGLLDFMIFADPAGYSDWIAGFFLNPQVADASPSSDPDHDQRSNFFERAFGSHPLIADREPIPYSMNRDGDFIVLSVTRPIGITDLRYAFDVSRDLNGWTGTEMLNTEPWTEDHGDGTETLFIRLLDYAPATEPHFYYRLRVDEVPSE